jgi:hypothetical protein
MKRLAVSLGELASWDNLLLATWKAARGKRSRPQVQAFLADLDGALARLAAGILDGAVPVGRYREFLIHDPKLRRIHAACFEDRVLHHAILNLVGPVFERSLVDSSYACRPGMGSHAAVLRAQQHLRRHAWFGQVDVAGYFPAINHVTLKGSWRGASRVGISWRYWGASLMATRRCRAMACLSGRSPPSTLPITTSMVLIACCAPIRPCVPTCATWTTCFGGAHGGRM